MQWKGEVFPAGSFWIHKKEECSVLPPANKQDVMWDTLNGALQSRPQLPWANEEYHKVLWLLQKFVGLAEAAEGNEWPSFWDWHHQGL